MMFEGIFWIFDTFFLVNLKKRRKIFGKALAKRKKVWYNTDTVMRVGASPLSSF